MKQHQTNRFISRAAAMLLTVIIAFAGAQTAGATDVVTYTISHITENGRYIYYFIGSDGSSQVVFDAKWERPTNVTLEMGSDVTFNVTTGGAYTCNYDSKSFDMLGFYDYFNTNNYLFTFTSKSRNITHIQIDGKGYVKFNKAKTTLEVDNNGKTCTVNWVGGSGGNRLGAPGKFIVTYETYVTYNISYVLNGGTNAAGNPSTYIKGTGVASLAAPTRTGYTFGGWYDNAGFQGDAVTSISTTATGDVTLYAKWTANTYTVAYNANGGSGTMDSQTFTYDAAQNLRANTFTNTGKLFDGWNTAADGSGTSYAASQSVNNLTVTNGATVTLYAQWKDDPGYITGSGTASDPYVISSEEQWNTFANAENYKTYYGSEKHVQLGANISGVTTTVGTQARPFQGTFNGRGYTLAVSISETSTQGTAPFREISGATIKHLTVTGSVTGTTHAAGLVGFSRSGTNTIEDCNVSANVTVNTGSNKHCGGLVGHAVTSTLTIRNSIYSGTISSGGNYAGGLQGWSDGSTLNIENSLCSGTYTGNGQFHPIAVRDNNATMSGTVSGAYYTATPTLTTASRIAAEGTQAYTSRQSFPCKSATILGNTVYYAADLTPFGKTGSYTPDGTASKPYIISTTDGWEYFCDALQDNNTWNRFSGKTIRLGANITVSRMAGGSGHSFTGTFDGYGHTLTLNYGTADTPVDAQFVAPFVETAADGSNQPAFRNLTIDGTIYASNPQAADHYHVGGLIGHLYGDVTIEHCNSLVHITAPSGAGGFVGLCEHTAMFTDCLSSAVITSPGGNNSGFVGWSRASGHAISFDGCTFNGKLLQQNGNGSHNGGFIGWTGANKTVTITNCLCAPATLASGETMASGNSTTFARGWNATTTATNSYYTAALGMAQCNQAYAVTTAPANLGAAVTGVSYSVLTAYANGIHFGGKYYVAPEEVTLYDNATNDLTGVSGYVADVTLQGRKLYTDGAWNTLCLPFAMTAGQIADSPLAGADIRALSTTIEHKGATTGFDPLTGTLTLNFTPAAPASGAVNAIEAGVPYIVKWPIPDGMTPEAFAAAYAANPDDYDLKNPVFTGVTVTNDNPAECATTSDDTYVTFVGTYSPAAIYADPATNLYLGSGNTLYWPSSAKDINSFRAYFQLNNGLTAGTPSSPKAVRAFSLNFGDGNATQTGIISIENGKLKIENSAAAAWYDLQGRKLSAQPTKKGLYIHNGNKVVIK